MRSAFGKTLKTALAAAAGGTAGALVGFLENGGDFRRIDWKYLATAATIAVLHLWVPSPNQPKS